MIDDSDEQLLARVGQARSERAFKILYDRHTPYLWRLALRLCGGDSDRAQEVVAESWVRAAGRLSSFRRSSAFRTWVAGFLVNVSREMARAERRIEPLDDRYDPSLDEEPAVVSRIDIDRALERLPHGFRQVLVLHDVEGFTHEEIGDMLGIVAGTSKSQLSRARRRVRELLHEPERA